MSIDLSLCQTLFEEFMKRCLLKKKVCLEEDIPKFTVGDYEAATSSVVVEVIKIIIPNLTIFAFIWFQSNTASPIFIFQFYDADIAKKVQSSLQGIEFMMDECHLSLTSSTYLDSPDPFVDLEDFRDRNKARKRTAVNCSGLAAPFSKVCVFVLKPVRYTVTGKFENNNYWFVFVPESFWGIYEEVYG